MNTRVYTIAEVGQAHDGSLGILHSYIDALAATGVSAVKFQTHIAEAESSFYEPFRVNFSYVDKTRYDYWERMSFSVEQWKEIKSHCEDVGVEFVSSPFSIAAVELLEKLDVSKYKIGSGEVSNYLMLEKIAQTGKPIILSSGMSSYGELKETLDFLSSYNSSISVLQCTTNYPTPPDRIGLNVIPELKNLFGLPVGLSDHSGSIYPSVAAVALGAEILEFHAVFDKRMFGPDSSSSLTIDQISELVRAVEFIKKSMNNPVDKSSSEAFGTLKSMFGKSLAVNADLPEGHILNISDLESKKPAGYGIPAAEYSNVLGKKLKISKDRYSFLREEDLQ